MLGGEVADERAGVDGGGLGFAGSQTGSFSVVGVLSFRRWRGSGAWELEDSRAAFLRWWRGCLWWRRPGCRYPLKVPTPSAAW